MTQYVGWYSAKQARVLGVVCYSTPDGREVNVTEVMSDDTPSRFSDAVCVGPVFEYLRSTSNPERGVDDNMRLFRHREGLDYHAENDLCPPIGSGTRT